MPPLVMPSGGVAPLAGAADVSVSLEKPKAWMIAVSSLSKLTPVELSFCLVMADWESQTQLMKPAVDARRLAVLKILNNVRAVG